MAQGSQYSLSISNADISNKAKAYSNQSNKLVLTITNNTHFDIEFGPSTPCRSIQLKIANSILSSRKNALTVNSPWSLKNKLVKKNDLWVVKLIPDSVQKLAKDGGKLEIDIELTPNQNGPGTIELACEAISFLASATLQVSGATTDGDPLIGFSNPLAFTYTVNSGSFNSPVFASEAVTPESYKVENTIQLNLAFQNKNLPQSAKTAHPNALMQGWNTDHPPFFLVYFPFQVASSSKNPTYFDLTDAFKVGDAGYNGWTSGWNIKCSLEVTDPDKTENDFWRIEMEKSNLYPVWKIYPKSQSVFTTSQNNGQPGSILNLYFSHIYSALPVDINNPQTVLYFQWFNFNDIDTSSSAIVTYNDGGNNATLNKLPNPNIERFNIASGTYFATQDSTSTSVIYDATYKQDDVRYAVFPANSFLYFQFEWLINIASQYLTKFSAALVPPNANEGDPEYVPGSYSSFAKDYSEQYTINTVTQLYKTTQPWTLRVLYEGTTVVGEQKITPFIDLITFLNTYLVGKIYSNGTSMPNDTATFFAFLSSDKLLFSLYVNDGVNPAALTIYYGSWSLSQSASAIVLNLSVTNDGTNYTAYTFNYNPSNDSWTSTSDNITPAITLAIPVLNWSGLSNLAMQPTANDVLAFRELNRRLYLCFRQATGLYFTSSADGWNWENKKQINNETALLAPSLDYYENQWLVIYGSSDGTNNTLEITTSTDNGQNWDTPTQSSLLSPSGYLQAFSHGDTQYIYAYSDQATTTYLLFRNSTTEQWNSASSPGGNTAFSQIIFYNGQPYVLQVDGTPPDQAGSLFIDVITQSGGNNSFTPTTVNPLYPTGNNVNYLLAFGLPNNNIATLGEFDITVDYQNKLVTGTSPLTLSASQAQEAINYINYDTSRPSAIFFKNYLLRTSSIVGRSVPSATSSLSGMMTYKSYFSWPQPVADAGGASWSNSLATMTVNGRSTLFMAYVKTSGEISIVSSINGSVWSETSDSTLNVTTAANVVLQVFNWTLWLSYADNTSKNVYTLTSSDGVTWNNQKSVDATVQTSLTPTFLLSPKTQELYLLLVDTAGGAHWYQVAESNGTYIWNDVSSAGNDGLPATTMGVTCAISYGQQLYLALSNSGSLAIYYTPSFGTTWTAVTLPSTPKLYYTPSFTIIYNQLAFVYADSPDGTQNNNYLKMIRSIDGQTWLNPESLYIPIVSNPSLSFWNDRLCLAITSSLDSNMVSIMNSSGIESGNLPVYPIIEEVTSLMPEGEIISIYTYFPANLNPNQSNTYLLVFNNSQYYIYKKKLVRQPYEYVTWQDAFGGPLPNLSVGYTFIDPFIVLPDGKVVLTASKNPPQNELWVLDDGTYYTSYGMNTSWITYNPQSSNAYVSLNNVSGQTQVLLSPVVDGNGTWSVAADTNPGGNDIFVPLTTNETLIPSFGYLVSPGNTPIVGSDLTGANNNVNLLNLTGATAYYFTIDSSGTKGAAATLNANESVTLAAQNGTCWLIASDDTGDTPIQYIKLESVTFDRVEVSAQGSVFAIHQSQGSEGEVYYLNSQSEWQDLGLKGVSLSCNSSGDLVVASANGQLLKVSQVAGTENFTTISLGNTFLKNISSISVDKDDVIWILAENGEIFRSLNEIPLASDTYLDLCVFNNALYMAYRADEQILLVNSLDGASWSEPINANVEAAFGPTLATGNNQLELCYISPYLDASGNLNTAFAKSSSDGITWTAGVGTSTGTIAASAPAMSFLEFNGNSAFIVADVDINAQQINLVSSPNGVTWTAITSPGTQAPTLLPVSMSVLGTTLYVAYVNPTGSALSVIATTDGTTWSPVDLQGTYTSDNSPVIVFFENELVLAYKDSSSGELAIITSTDGATWSPKKIDDIDIVSDFSMVPFQGQGDSKELLYLVFVDGEGAVRTRVIQF